MGFAKYVINLVIMAVLCIIVLSIPELIMKYWGPDSVIPVWPFVLLALYILYRIFKGTGMRDIDKIEYLPRSRNW